MKPDTVPRSMMVLGLTGSIGMGKSTTAQIFRDAGVPVFDADAEVHALYGGEAVAPIEAAFPGVTRDGTVDRTMLRQRVLEDPSAFARIEAIVHPMVAARRRAFLDQAKADRREIVVLDIPLLFETGADATVDAIVVVSANEAVQKTRVLTRPGMTEAAFSAIVAKQVPDAEKRRRATFVVETGHGVDHARARVAEILRAIQGEAAQTHA